VDSPTGFSRAVNEGLQGHIEELGYAVEISNKRLVKVSVKGKSSAKRLALSAHVDTLGALVKGIDGDGKIRFSVLGGPILPTWDGEYCRIYADGGKCYTGTFLSDSPSCHVYKDAGTKERNEDTMYVRIDEVVECKADVEKRKLKNAFNHREMEDNDVILPPTYKENTGWQSIINIGIGLALGVIVVLFMILPARDRSLNYQHNQEMRIYADKLNLANQEADKLRKAAEQLKAEKGKAEANLENLIGDSDSTLVQYQTLVEILQAYRSEDFETAVKQYMELDTTKITNENMLNILSEIEADMAANAPAVLEKLAIQSTESGDADQALRYYEEYMKFDDRNPHIIFNMAMIYKKKGEEETSDQLFGQVIMNFDDEELAAKAKEERGY
ncbi:MAG: hypothetical protein IIW68_01895, partial [Lachnospiraceae bacterium]|nr:hypothetical protein [Lachnospiraceae bacterium]